MTNEKWDGKTQAPQSLFRVVGEDSFSIPPSEYWVGDFADYNQAREAARAEAGPMNPVRVYDDQNHTKFIIG